jgi:MFS family permease
MSFSDRAILWLHIGVAIFTIGPVTAAIMSTPRYIRKRNTLVVGYLHRTTRIYGIASLLVFIFGAVLAGQLGDFSKPWVSISMTLFIVALVLTALILRDQNRAFEALERVDAAAAARAASPVPGVAATAELEASDDGGDDHDDEDGKKARDGKTVKTAPAPAPGGVEEAAEIAAVERGRIASMGGITGLIWIVILILMVWK